MDEHFFKQIWIKIVTYCIISIPWTYLNIVNKLLISYNFLLNFLLYFNTYNNWLHPCYSLEFFGHYTSTILNVFLFFIDLLNKNERLFLFLLYILFTTFFFFTKITHYFYFSTFNLSPIYLLSSSAILYSELNYLLEYLNVSSIINAYFLTPSTLRISWFHN